MSALSDPWQAAGRAVSSVLGRNSRIINVLRPAYEMALACVHQGRGIPWEINGQPFRIDPRHRQLMGRLWDPEVAEFLSSHLRPGQLCLDVGANAGVYVLQFCRWTQPDGKVIAFEPNPITRRVLTKHIHMNGLDKRVDVAPFAVSDQEGESQFSFAGASGMSRLGQANSALESVAQTTTVATTTLDAFCGQRALRPDWILIDIEGHELYALRGARALLERCPDLQIIVEMHPNLWPSAQTALEDWHHFLASASLQPISLTGQKNPLEEYGSILLRRTM